MMTSNTLARQSTVLDIIDEYEEKAANVENAIKAYEDACTAIEMAGMREFNRRKRASEAGTNVPTGMLKMRRRTA